jgi:His/Glu/Gln/Arg/opine family amino acid ABC transporter permease subunit
MEKIVYYYFNIKFMLDYLPDLLRGLVLTLEMAALIIIYGITGGLILAVFRSFNIKPLNFLIIVFVDIFRAVPSLVIIIFIYFALPFVQITLSSFAAVTLSLSLVLSSYAEEIFWAGLTSVPHGQREAARSTGLNRLQTLRWIIIPQALRLSIPPLTSRTIAITKGTSLASVVAVQEILNRAISAQADIANPSPLMLGAILYLIVFAPLVSVSRRIEKSFSKWET